MHGSLTEAHAVRMSHSMSPPPPAVETQTVIPTISVATLSEWSEWEPCSRSCGSGRTSRSRQCELPRNPAQVVEVNCQGELHEVKFCNTEPCPSKCVI